MDFGAILGTATREAVGSTAAVYALAAIGLNVHYGYTGLLNFGQVGFMLLGAYGLGITVATFGGSFWLGLLVAALLATGFALLLGVPTLRLRSDYFAITTIAAAEILRLLVRSGSSTDLTGGPFGLQGIANTFYELNPIPAGNYGFGRVLFTRQQLWVTLVTWALVALASWFVYRAVHSPWGRVLKSIREDEDAARSLGKNVFNYKMQSLVIGGLIGALAGVMFATVGSSANADSYLPVVTFRTYAILILGGAATAAGPVIGSIVFWFLVSGMSAGLREASAAGYVPLASNEIGALTLAMVGLGLMLLMIFRPQGMLGSKREMLLDAH